MIDRLIEQCEAKGNPSVVGLDPTMELIPGFMKDRWYESQGRTAEAAASMFREFNMNIVDAVADIVPAVKLQIAMYEKYGAPGIEAYDDSCRYARSRGLIVIGDIKRGDISSTAAAYASHISPVNDTGSTAGNDISPEFYAWHQDAVTLNPYMGSDSISAFKDKCKKYDKGIFVLVKTSNPSSSDIQDLVLKDGRRVYEAAAGLVEEWGRDLRGRYGYSEIGAVVGGTQGEAGRRLRGLMPHSFFLIPGYGAQGASASDIVHMFDSEHRGAVVNSSRGIIGAYKNAQNNGYYMEKNYADAARDAASAMKNDLSAAFGNM